MSNERHDQFFNSVRNAMAEGFNWNDFFIVFSVALAVVILGWMLSTLSERWYFLKQLVFRFASILPFFKDRPELRYLTKCPVRILTPQTGVKMEKNTTTNLSPGGMFLRRAIPFPERTSFDFVLYLGKDKIEGVALVRWIQPAPKYGTPPGMGCEFIQITPEERNKIRLWLRKQETAGIIRSKK